MPYLMLAQIKAALPTDITEQLLDDQGSGIADPSVWPEILAAVTREIDGKIGQRYPLPLAEPVPQIVTNAAFVLAAELLYQRKGFFGEANPWTKRAEQIRGTQGQQGGQAGLLDRIASGEEPLTTAARPQHAPAVAITTPAKTTPSTGNILC
jgi:phage gp36-like protein